MYADCARVCAENNHCPHEAGYDAYMCGCGKSDNVTDIGLTSNGMSWIDVMHV